jgi:hypothetical protein
MVHGFRSICGPIKPAQLPILLGSILRLHSQPNSRTKHSLPPAAIPHQLLPLFDHFSGELKKKKKKKKSKKKTPLLGFFFVCAYFVVICGSTHWRNLAQYSLALHKING